MGFNINVIVSFYFLSLVPKKLKNIYVASTCGFLCIYLDSVGLEQMNNECLWRQGGAAKGEVISPFN